MRYWEGTLNPTTSKSSHPKANYQPNFFLPILPTNSSNRPHHSELWKRQSRQHNFLVLCEYTNISGSREQKFNIFLRAPMVLLDWTTKMEKVLSVTWWPLCAWPSSKISQSFSAGSGVLGLGTTLNRHLWSLKRDLRSSSDFENVRQCFRKRRISRRGYWTTPAGFNFGASGAQSLAHSEEQPLCQSTSPCKQVHSQVLNIYHTMHPKLLAHWGILNIRKKLTYSLQLRTRQRGRRVFA